MPDDSGLFPWKQAWRTKFLGEAYPYYVLGWCPPEDMPAVAVNELLAGREGTALAQLAGLHKPTRAEVDDVLPAVLRELGVPHVTRNGVWEATVRDTVDRIVSGDVSPNDGSLLLFRLEQEQDNDPDDLLDTIISLGFLLDSGEFPESLIEQEIVREAERLQRQFSARHGANAEDADAPTRT